jgi:hypothetical protein
VEHVLNLAWLAKLLQFQHPEKILHLLVALTALNRPSEEPCSIFSSGIQNTTLEAIRD